MNIAIFGGAFDPPHLGHKTVANSLIKNKIVDQVWFVPVFKHPWADRYSKRKLAPYDLRAKMLESNLGDQQKVAHFKDVSFTYDTLVFFKNKFPEDNFSWVMGSEYLDRFDDFLEGHPKLIDFRFYIYPRIGHPFQEDLKKNNMIFLKDMQEIKASSTHVKEEIRAGNNIDHLVSKEVKDIIDKNRLYF